ncbi:ankyrin repeat and kh domain-containing protein 1 [Nannochloropsis gaditana CCMP526]|uniref:ankyrin repeat and kh domain-containing protein 1 n=1 Tax=Nannochloropsis gaditana (strain CCMP526) TaxID=1093141 RepID=UPI00029F77EF|nr:ankyrin repeat and kh domain-containing protein 1 [Nannochloropsis gaditana CCMP526]EKU20991.1 ankyrin repeat and kh domain-containing protein 1 [Nannochloropsis gaditana CCMP526]|eukprot:XP_005855373.1 ankyrin repeat and kh domain-containing protein 1 [Nannochloropsis gaditana CCMP526]
MGWCPIHRCVFRRDLPALCQILSETPRVPPSAATSSLSFPSSYVLPSPTTLRLPTSFIDEPSAFNCTALMLAVGEGLGAMAMILVAHGADVNLRDDNGLSALYLGCMRGHASIVSFLLYKGADPTVTSQRDNTSCLHIAVLHHYAHCVHALLHGLPPDLRQALLQHRDAFDHTALDYAVGGCIHQNF